MQPTAVPEIIRRLAMAVLMLVHIQFAAFLIGIFGLAVAMELFGILSTGHPHFDRLAHGLARTAVLIYSTGAVIAIIFVLVIALFWPSFWYLIMRINLWPMVLEAVTFVLTILYLFPWYYTWDSLARFKGVHVALGLALVFVAEMQQSMIDVMAGYMLTPTPPQNLLRVFFNASAIPLDMHRIVGDLSFAGFVVGGYAGYKTLRSKDDDRRRFFEWVGNIGLIAGLGFLFLQPAIGVAYVEEIRANSPGAFTEMMRGSLSAYFLLQVVLLGGLFFFSVLYMALRSHRRIRPGNRLLWGLLVLMGLSALLLMQPYVIGPSQSQMWINWVNPIGSMQPWKYIALAGLTLGSIGALLVYLARRRASRPAGQMNSAMRSAQYVLIVLAVFASATMATMGYIREAARQPYLIYYEQPLNSPEKFPASPTPTPAGHSSSQAPNSAASNSAGGAR